MKVKKIIAMVLAMVLFCLSSLGTAVAAEPEVDYDGCLIDVRMQSTDTYEILVNGEVYIYNDITGEITNCDEAIVGHIISQPSNTQGYAMYATRPTGIQHGMTVGTRWIYSYSQWSTVEFYEKANETMVAILTGFFIGKGLAQLVKDPRVASAIGRVVGKFIGWLDTNNLDINENALYVRTYVYGNRNILSNFAEIYQGYCTDYTPLDVIAYDQEITY